MAKDIEVAMVHDSTKNQVIKYVACDDDGTPLERQDKKPIANVYIYKDALAKAGYKKVPKRITITVTDD